MVSLSWYYNKHLVTTPQSATVHKAVSVGRLASVELIAILHIVPNAMDIRRGFFFGGTTVYLVLLPKLTNMCVYYEGRHDEIITRL
jgi:hypothetical protein